MSATSFTILRTSDAAPQYSQLGSGFPSLSRPVKMRTGRVTPATGVTAALTTTWATSTVSWPNASAWLTGSGNSTVGMSNRWPCAYRASSTFFAGSHRNRGS